MAKEHALKLVHDADDLFGRVSTTARAQPVNVLRRALADGVLHGDADQLLHELPRESVDLFFTSPPYADARAYTRIHPDRYVDWFLPFARSMYKATKPSGNLIKHQDQAWRQQRAAEKTSATLTSTNWCWPFRTWAGAGSKLTSGRSPTVSRVGSVQEPKITLSMSITSPGAPRPHFDLDAVQVPIKPMKLRLLGVNGTRPGADVLKPASAVIGPKPTCWVVRIPGMW